MDPSQIEQRTDLVKTAGIDITAPGVGILTANVADLIRVAELYSRSGVMVPPHCRDKPGVCFALCDQAITWGLPYLAVINKSYVVNNRGVERIAYESQIIHAVIEKNAPIKGRLRAEWTGEGDERRCKIIGTFKGEDKPHEYESQPLAKLRDARGRNESGTLKGSPLWDHDPDVQLFYSASRQWARLYCPDVILGAYTPDELDEPVDVTPKVSPLQQRLRDAQKAHGDRGFDLDHVKRETGRTVIEGDANPGVVHEEAKNVGDEHQSDVEGRQDGGADRADGDNHPRGDGEAVGGAAAVVEDVAGKGTEGGKAEVGSKARASKPQQGKRK